MPQEEKVDEESRRPPVVADQIGEQKIDHSGVKDEACHSHKDYSSNRYKGCTGDCMMTGARGRSS